MGRMVKPCVILNEVLSLNAQESSSAVTNRPTVALLNEVLSLNAQEYVARMLFLSRAGSSSMKS